MKVISLVKYLIYVCLIGQSTNLCLGADRTLAKPHWVLTVPLDRLHAIMAGVNSLCYFHVDLNHIRQKQLSCGVQEKSNISKLSGILILFFPSPLNVAYFIRLYIQPKHFSSNNENNKAWCFQGVLLNHIFFHSSPKHNTNGSSSPSSCFMHYCCLNTACFVCCRYCEPHCCSQTPAGTLAPAASLLCHLKREIDKVDVKAFRDTWKNIVF